MTQKLLRTNEAAQYLGVSRSSLASWIRQGLIQGGATPGGHYRFTMEELNAFAKKRGLQTNPAVLESKSSEANDPADEEKRKRILVVDDDEAFHELVTEALDIFTGFELKSAMDGMKGALLIGSWKPDLIILDIRMPNMDGKELLTLIRENPETADLHVIIASAHLSDDLKADFAKLRPDMFLEKPVHVVKLVAAIQKSVNLELA